MPRAGLSRAVIAADAAEFADENGWDQLTCAAVADGRSFSSCSTLVVPVSLTSAAVTVVSGLMLVRFGCGMREPVTTNSCTVLPVDPPDASG